MLVVEDMVRDKASLEKEYQGADSGMVQFIVS